MMILLYGENVYERDAALRKLKHDFDGEILTCVGDEIELAELPDLLMGQTLFSQKRMVVIKRLSENTSLWQKLEEWHARVSSDITVTLVEDKPDKRTHTWKFLQKHADIREFVLWTKKDIGRAVEWAIARAKRAGFTLTMADGHYLVERAGLEQYKLATAIEKLLLAGKSDKLTIDAVTEEKVEDTAFGLLEQSLQGDIVGLQKTLTRLKLTEDPYRVMALLSSQFVQLSVVQAMSDASPAEIAREIGAPPFVVTRLKKVSGKYSTQHLQLAADTDYAMKTTNAVAWELVERLLLEIATR